MGRIEYNLNIQPLCRVVFFFISLVIGGLCGAFGMIFVDSNPEWFENSPAGANDQATCFM